MKRFIVLTVFICIIAASCTNIPPNSIKTVSSPVKSQKYIGRVAGNVSFTRTFEDKILLQKELETCFDIYSIDMKSPVLSFQYTIKPQDKLLYSKQLDAERTLKVKQMGNGEENNVLILEDKSTKNIAKKIAYSETALVSLSPSENYVLYCAADDVVNRYGLYLYNLQTEKTLQLIDTVNEELLNDMEWNISWSPDEAYIIVANQLVISISSGKMIAEIKAENTVWSYDGSKMAYIKTEKGYGKSICVLDIETKAAEEVFIVNQGEYLPGNLIWNKNETKLAFTTAIIMGGSDLNTYKAIYSLDLTNKEAQRVDTILQMDEGEVEKLYSLHYNAKGNILAFSTAHFSGYDLYVYDTNTGDFEFYINTEYLHDEDNESYACSAGESIYFVQGQNVIEVDNNMNSKLIYKSADAIEDIYITKDGSSMLIVEKTTAGVVLRQLENFAGASMQ